MSGIKVLSESRSQDLGEDLSVPCLSHSFWDCQQHLALFLADTSLQSLSTSSHMSSTVCVSGLFLFFWGHQSFWIMGPPYPSYGLLLTKTLFLNKISSWSSKKEMKEGNTSNPVHSPYSCPRVQMTQQPDAPEHLGETKVILPWPDISRTPSLLCTVFRAEGLVRAHISGGGGH